LQQASGVAEQHLDNRRVQWDRWRGVAERGRWSRASALDMLAHRRLRQVSRSAARGEPTPIGYGKHRRAKLEISID